MELIDQHLFIEALAIFSFEVCYTGVKQPSNIEKVCFILEKMNQSKGPILIQKQTGHTRSPTGLAWDLLDKVR